MNWKDMTSKKRKMGGKGLRKISIYIQEKTSFPLKKTTAKTLLIFHQIHRHTQAHSDHNKLRSSSKRNRIVVSEIKEVMRS